MNYFEKAGNIERRRLTKLTERLNLLFLPTPDRTFYDGIICSPNNPRLIGVEAKCRTVNTNWYSSAMIEREKYDRLMSLTSVGFSHIWYIFFYNDGHARVWDLTSLPEPIWEFKELQHKTALVGTDYDTGTIVKEVGYLDNSQQKLVISNTGI